MPTHELIYPHQQRVRTRSTAFLLALGAFVAIKLVSLGVVNVSRAHELDGIEGLQMLDVECGAEQAVHC